jgi:hypothetical protein
MTIYFNLEVTPLEIREIWKLHSERLLKMGHARNGAELRERYTAILGQERADQIIVAGLTGQHIQLTVKQ